MLSWEYENFFSELKASSQYRLQVDGGFWFFEHLPFVWASTYPHQSTILHIHIIIIIIILLLLLLLILSNDTIMNSSLDCQMRIFDNLTKRKPRSILDQYFNATSSCNKPF